MADNAPYDPATRTGESSAAGNMGANNPGVPGADNGIGAGTRGVKTDTDVARGYVNPGDTGTEAGSDMGAGGLSGAGLREIPTDSPEEQEIADILANTGVPGGANSADAGGATSFGTGLGPASLSGSEGAGGSAALTGGSGDANRS